MLIVIKSLENVSIKKAINLIIQNLPKYFNQWLKPRLMNSLQSYVRIECWD